MIKSILASLAILCLVGSVEADPARSRVVVRQRTVIRNRGFVGNAGFSRVRFASVGVGGYGYGANFVQSAVYAPQVVVQPAFVQAAVVVPQVSYVSAVVQPAVVQVQAAVAVCPAVVAQPALVPAYQPALLPAATPCLGGCGIGSVSGSVIRQRTSIRIR